MPPPRGAPPTVSKAVDKGPVIVGVIPPDFLGQEGHTGLVKEGGDGSGMSSGSVRKRGRRPAKRLLLSNIGSKAISLVTNGRRRKDAKDSEEDYEFDFGDGGVWQRSILMGDKCRPLDFSGVIYYDESGKQHDHVPLKSPRASPLPGYLTRHADGDVRA